MKFGYSKFLINENIIFDIGVYFEYIVLDMMMIMLLSFKEWICVDWEEFLGKVGLKISGVYIVVWNVESLIECEFVDGVMNGINGMNGMNEVNGY